MFIETHNSEANGGIALTFIKSLNVQAYPCGRRRANVDPDKNPETVTDRYFIPFDPEARLNTEANNRRHSSLNGFDQTYIGNWDNNSVSLALAGYLFNISNIELVIDNETITDVATVFGMGIAPDATNGTCIYANIRIEETPLFETAFNTIYYTEILRDQTPSPRANTNIDCMRSPSSTDTDEERDIEDVNNYYFSGLSFSTIPLASNSPEETRCIKPHITPEGVKQRLVSLKILEKIGDSWQLNQEALLPDIKHGDIEDSIKVGTIFADDIKIKNTSDTGDDYISVPSLRVVKQGSGNTYQLQFFNVEEIE